MSNIRPRSFRNETCWTGLLLKKISGCTTFLTLRVNITSCACLDGSGLKLVFYWKALFVFFVEIFTKLFNCYIWIIYYCKQRSVVCSKFRVWLWRFLLRSIKKAGTPSLTKPMMNIGHLVRPVSFYYLGKLSITVINCHKYHYDVINPLCRTLSNVSNISWKPLLTSNPSSKPLKIYLELLFHWEYNCS